LSSLAQLLLRLLDQTEHLFSLAGDANRPCQEQVRACGRKRPLTSTTDHPASTGETTCLYQDGPDAPGPAGKHGADLETSPRHRSARDAAAVASPGLQTLLEVHIEGNFSQTKDLPGDRGLDERDGKGQSPSSEQSGSGANCSNWASASASAPFRST